MSLKTGSLIGREGHMCYVECMYVRTFLMPIVVCIHMELVSSCLFFVLVLLQESIVITLDQELVTKVNYQVVVPPYDVCTARIMYNNLFVVVLDATRKFKVRAAWAVSCHTLGLFLLQVLHTAPCFSVHQLQVAMYFKKYHARAKCPVTLGIYHNMNTGYGQETFS